MVDDVNQFAQKQLRQKSQKKYVTDKFAKKQAEKQAGRFLGERNGSTHIQPGAAPEIKTTEQTSKFTPKSKHAANSTKVKRSLSLKSNKPGAKTSKAVLGMRKANQAKATRQLKQQAVKTAKVAAKRAAAEARRLAQMLKAAAGAIVKALSMVIAATGPFFIILIAFAGIAMMIASPFGLFLRYC